MSVQTRATVSSKEKIEVTGTVIEALPDTILRVVPESGQQVLAYV